MDVNHQFLAFGLGFGEFNRPHADREVGTHRPRPRARTRVAGEVGFNPWICAVVRKSDLKVAVSSAFVGSVISETVASNAGIGYLMAVAASDFNTRLAFGGLQPVMQRLGIASTAEIDVDSLQERLLAEASASEGAACGFALASALAAAA